MTSDPVSVEMRGRIRLQLRYYPPLATLTNFRFTISGGAVSNVISPEYNRIWQSGLEIGLGCWLWTCATPPAIALCPILSHKLQNSQPSSTEQRPVLQRYLSLSQTFSYLYYEFRFLCVWLIHRLHTKRVMKAKSKAPCTVDNRNR
jgi:hypothetical protein